MKHIQTFESFLEENSLNYTQAMELGSLGDVVKNHIKSNYSELYYGGPNNILGKYGKDIPGTSWKKLEKLAKDKGDKDLEIAISNYKDLATKYKVKTFESLSESKDEIIFSVDDDKLDQLLNARFSRQLDYKDDRGDSLYVLPKRDFDRFIDLADSSGFDVDYENSKDSVIYVQESVVNEGSDEQVKKECISRLSDFFRVPQQTLSKFNFDGKDNIKELTKALNSTSDQGTELYYQTAIKSVKKDLGINEDLEVNEASSSDEFFDYYIAKTDAVVKDPKGKKITIPSGTVIYARGLGRWVSADGKILVGIEVLKGNTDFDVVNNSTWPDTLNLTDEIEAWGRSTNDLIQKDPKNVQKIIDARAKVIGDIRKMLK